MRRFDVAAVILNFASALIGMTGNANIVSHFAESSESLLITPGRSCGSRKFRRSQRNLILMNRMAWAAHPAALYVDRLETSNG